MNISKLSSMFFQFENEKQRSSDGLESGVFVHLGEKGPC